MSSFHDLPSDEKFNKAKHIQYFKACLHMLPEHYTGLETSHISAIYFAVVGLDILGEIDNIDKLAIIEYIYGMQIPSHLCTIFLGHCGFIGSSYLGQKFGENSFQNTNNINETTLDETVMECSRYMEGHLAMAYTALSTLITLGDDLSRIDKIGLLSHIRNLQQSNGSFQATFTANECDLRFVYCACAISTLLDDWSAVDKDVCMGYILSCISYEGGMGLVPFSEAHGGSTYCGLASLALMDRMDALSPTQRSELIRWCINRQLGGFQGRTNKDPDSCYSYWIGASIHILEQFEDIDVPGTSEFLLGHCQYYAGMCYGGFGKLPGSPPDILHSLFSLIEVLVVGSIHSTRLASEVDFLLIIILAAVEPNTALQISQFGNRMGEKSDEDFNRRCVFGRVLCFQRNLGLVGDCIVSAVVGVLLDRWEQWDHRGKLSCDENWDVKFISSYKRRYYVSFGNDGPCTIAQAKNAKVVRSIIQGAFLGLFDPNSNHSQNSPNRPNSHYPKHRIVEFPISPIVHRLSDSSTAKSRQRQNGPEAQPKPTKCMIIDLKCLPGVYVEYKKVVHKQHRQRCVSFKVPSLSPTLPLEQDISKLYLSRGGGRLGLTCYFTALSNTPVVPKLLLNTSAIRKLQVIYRPSFSYSRRSPMMSRNVPPTSSVLFGASSVMLATDPCKSTTDTSACSSYIEKSYFTPSAIGSGYMSRLSLISNSCPHRKQQCALVTGGCTEGAQDRSRGNTYFSVI
eukprot:gene858-1668_t